jgi:hypothetical protein
MTINTSPHAAGHPAPDDRPTGDKTLTCRDCGRMFHFRLEEQRHFARQAWPPPVRCAPCRVALRKAVSRRLAGRF